ncbi:fanconi-associated nuclease 1-like [Frankliniella occidentalis]|uniref:Fanconi-associated nuclease n=1 Tax=Frankliniella occidentalis TaxID=133901 RepID=A0A9C6XVV6_FRAOC|nr:fanconi-associated nuclease 1-like [Frankliniella occidentalis]
MCPAPTAIDDGELRDVLALLLVDELEQITVSLGVKTGRRTRLALVRALLRLRVSGPQQGCLLQERVRGVLGGCVRVLAGPRELVVRALLSVAAWLPVPRDGNRLRAVRTILLQDCPRLLVPEGLPGGHGPTQSMFHTRQQLLDWQAVVNERVALGKAIAGGKTTEVLTISAEVLVQLRAHLESNNTTTPQSRAIGGAMVELLDAASEALAREADVDAAAVTVLRVLLGQHELVQERRAAWAVRLAALLQTRMLDYQGAAELLVRELEDGGHRGSHRCRLEERARTVLRGSKCAVGKGVRGALEDTCARLQALLPDKDRPEFPTVTIRSSACARSAPGMKRVYVSKPRGQAVEYLSVEERAMVHYADEYPRGADDEGETLLSLAVLALWKEVYDAEVSGAWGTPVQDRPLDWGTDSFWVARHLTMEQRLQSMLRRAQDAGEEAGSRALAADLSKAREARHGTPSLVRWDLLQGLDIEELLKCLTVPLFVAICRRFFLDFCSYRQGFPDLLLWNPENGKSLFVEVKGPEDTLGPHQVKWLEFLRSHEAQVEIAIVQVRTE